MKNRMRSSVYLLYTGGTIGMVPQATDNPDSPLVAASLEQLQPYLPSLTSIGIDTTYYAFENPLDSSDVGPSHWQVMTEMIHEVYNDHDGFVILHGTDTLAYTASALSFMFENLAKPVVVTGSQLPISDQRTDAVSNLVNSIYIAGYRSTGLPLIPEVVTVFADKVLRGCRTAKISSTSWAGFDSPNTPPLGTIGEHIKIQRDSLRPLPPPAAEFQVRSQLSDRVVVISLSPGFDASRIEQLAKMEDVDAILLRTYGAGNAPTDASFLDAIERATARGKVVVNITQCMQGSVEMGLYETSSGLLERGVVSGLDMTPEAALTKLMWTLANRVSGQVVAQMQVSQRGEQSQNLFYLAYGSCGIGTSSVSTFVEFRTPDRRFEVNQLSHATLQFSSLRLSGLETGDSSTLRVFMNLVSASHDTPATDERCIAAMDVVCEGTHTHQLVSLDITKIRSCIGPDDVTLTVVVDQDIKISFRGLYLSLFCQA